MTLIQLCGGNVVDDMALAQGKVILVHSAMNASIDQTQKRAFVTLRHEVRTREYLHGTVACTFVMPTVVLNNPIAACMQWQKQVVAAVHPSWIIDCICCSRLLDWEDRRVGIRWSAHTENEAQSFAKVCEQ